MYKVKLGELNMPDLRIFYANVTAKVKALEEMHRDRAEQYSRNQDETEFQMQPRDGKSLFLVAKPNPYSGGKATVAEANLRLAAQRIIEGSHELATPEQIAAYFQRQADNLAVVTSMNNALESKRVVTVRAAEAPTRKK
jgi:hypothetical protein